LLGSSEGSRLELGPMPKTDKFGLAIWNIAYQSPDQRLRR
jgi:hypothetical protein